MVHFQYEGYRQNISLTAKLEFYLQLRPKLLIIQFNYYKNKSLRANLLDIIMKYMIFSIIMITNLTVLKLYLSNKL